MPCCLQMSIIERGDGSNFKKNLIEISKSRYDCLHSKLFTLNAQKMARCSSEEAAFINCNAPYDTLPARETAGHILLFPLLLAFTDPSPQGVTHSSSCLCSIFHICVPCVEHLCCCRSFQCSADSFWFYPCSTRICVRLSKLKQGALDRFLRYLSCVRTFVTHLLWKLP